MMIMEFTEDKFSKAMKAITKIIEHAECLLDVFEELSDDSEYGDRYGSKRYRDVSRYGRRI